MIKTQKKISCFSQQQKKCIRLKFNLIVCRLKKYKQITHYFNTSQVFRKNFCRGLMT